MIILFILHFNFLTCTYACRTCLCKCQLSKKCQTMINLILLPLRLKQMGKVQELAGLPALRREIHDVHKVDSCCKVTYIHTDMQTHMQLMWKVERIRKHGKKFKNYFIHIIFFQNNFFSIT